MKIYIISPLEKGLSIEFKSRFPFWDGKTYTIEEVKKNLLGKLDERALLYLKKKGYSFSNAEHLMPFILSCYEGKSSVGQELKSYKDEFIKLGYVEKNPYFAKYLIMNEVYITRLGASKEMLRILDKENISYTLIRDLESELIGGSSRINEEKIDFKHTLYKANSIEEEIRFLFYLIAKEYEKRGSYEKIKLLVRDDDALEILKRQNELNQYPFAFSKNVPLKKKKSYIDFEMDLLTLSLEDAILNADEELQSAFIRPYLILKDIYSSEEIKEYFLYLASKDHKEKEEGIEIYTDSYLPKSDEILFVPSFNATLFPKLRKDQSYPSDEIKEELGFLTTSEQNEMEKLYFDALYYTQGEVIFLKHQMGSTLERYPSPYEEKYQFNEKDIALKFISKNAYIYYLAQKEDNYRLYGNENPYSHLLTSDMLYRSYDYHFDKSNEFIIQHAIELSYTSASLYIGCPFSYLLKNIWHLDEFEDTLNTKIGNVFHKILEDHTKSIFKSLDCYINDNSFSKKEKFFIKKLYHQLEVASRRHDEFFAASCFNIEKGELDSLYMNIDASTILQGRIDSFLIDETHHYIGFLDYKTGAQRFSLDGVKKGIDLQLPIYYLLAKECYPDYEIIGFYISPILVSKYEKNLDPKEFNLCGMTRLENNLYELVDPNMEYLAGYKKTKSGTLAQRGCRIYDDKTFDDVLNTTLNYLKETADGIHQGNFEISPRIYNSDNAPHGCEYCNYKDVCFVKPKDWKRIILDSENAPKESES